MSAPHLPAVFPQPVKSCPAHNPLEVEPDLSRQRPRCHIMRPAERRQEVIQRRFVSQVDGGQLNAPLVLFTMEKIVIAQREIEKTPRLDALRIVIVVFGVRRRHADQCLSELRCKTRARQGLRAGCVHAIAGESGLKFLVGRQGRAGYGVNQVDRRLPI